MDSSETYISLYSGGAGLDMGFRRAVPNAQCVAYVEHEASAAALLVDHIEAQKELLDAAPVFTNAFTFPAGRFHGLVDWVIGGPPCQPFSVAGKRLGADDARNLWPLTLRMVAEIQPRGCFFENVPSADSLWYIYEEVIPGLRYLGYEVEAGIFSAAEVGAPHNRERIFILGHTGHSTRSTEQRQQPQGTGGRAGEPGEGTVADTRQLSGQVPQAGKPDGTQRDAATGTSGELADTICQRGCSGHSERQDAVHAFPPGPTGDWSDIPQRLWPAVKPGFRDVADELAGRVAALSRAQELRILGNGVVVATAERAFSVLSDRIGGIK